MPKAQAPRTINSLIGRNLERGRLLEKKRRACTPHYEKGKGPRELKESREPPDLQMVAWGKPHKESPQPSPRKKSDWEKKRGG